MPKIIIKYENEVDKIRIIEALAKGLKISRIHRSFKSNKYYKCCIEIE
ncbi:MAG: hypothetical protein ACLUC0_16450 [Clostridium neonatale]|nr:conserved hypothetical protein [Clostridium neonatale]